MDTAAAHMAARIEGQLARHRAIRLLDRLASHRSFLRELADDIEDHDDQIALYDLWAITSQAKNTARALRADPRCNVCDGRGFVLLDAEADIDCECWS